MAKILLIVSPNDFQPNEYDRPRQILQDAGVIVETASTRIGRVVSMGAKLVATADKKVAEVKAGDYNGIFLIGGPGAVAHLNNETVYSLMRQALEQCDLYGAICISPRILARAGVLRDKKATGWDGDGQLAQEFKQAGAEYIRQPVVKDGQVITAWGPDAAEEFGRTILGSL